MANRKTTTKTSRKTSKTLPGSRRMTLSRANPLRSTDNSLSAAAAQKVASAPLPVDKASPFTRWFADPLQEPNEYENLRDAIEGQAKRYKNKTYFIYEENGTEFSYADLDRETSINVNLFRALGADNGAAIGILDANTPEFVFLYMGCMKGGYTSAPLNYHLKAPELQYCLENSESQLLFVSNEYWGEVAKTLDKLTFLKAIVQIGRASCRERV